jgi:hypothetical protein
MAASNLRVQATSATFGGGVTAHSAGAAASMPKIGAPDLGSHVNSVPDHPSSARHSEEIRTYETPSKDRSENDKDTDKEDNSHGTGKDHFVSYASLRYHALRVRN